MEPLHEAFNSCTNDPSSIGAMMRAEVWFHDDRMRLIGKSHFDDIPQVTKVVDPLGEHLSSSCFGVLGDGD